MGRRSVLSRKATRMLGRSTARSVRWLANRNHDAPLLGNLPNKDSFARRPGRAAFLNREMLRVSLQKIGQLFETVETSIEVSSDSLNV